MNECDRARCTRSPLRWRAATHHRLPLGLAIAIVALEWFVLACSSAAPPYEAPAAGQPCIDCNVILVSADTLRANHLSAYGYDRPTSPDIDAFAETGVLFERARSQAPWTLPAHMSMLTSLYPTRHLVGEKHKLSDDTLTLADVLHDDGYRTVAFSAGGWIRRKRNFHTFDIFDDSGKEWKSTDFKRKPASFVRMMEWLDDDHPEKFFLFWHTKQTHCPHEPAPEFDRFTDPNYSGPIEVDGKCSGYYDDLLETITEADRQYIIGKYDGTVRTLDDKFGAMLRVLERRGLAARTIIVLTSDHGESFAERVTRRKIGHGIMYDEVTSVPLIVRIPGSEHKGRIAHNVETIDIMPTVIEALGLPVPGGLDGQSLFTARADSFAYSERRRTKNSKKRGGNEFALWYGNYILIYYKLYERFELYDLVKDPLQRDNLAGTGLPVEEHMKREMLARNAKLWSDALAAGYEAITVELDADDEAQLRALGYLE